MNVGRLDQNLSFGVSRRLMFERRADGRCRELARAVEARVAALARSQSLLTTVREEGAPLRAIVEQEIAPFAGHDRVTIDGPDIHVTARAAQALTMAIHELATNAAKYGALASEHGTVCVRWSVDGGKKP